MSSRWLGCLPSGPRPRGAAAALALGIWAGLGATALPVAAKTAHESPYTYEQTYGTAVRLVKVDLGLPVTEQDPDWGYLLFEYTSRESGARKSHGSFEFVRGRDGVRVAVQLATMPSYHERAIIDRLKRKLVEEHGTPPAPKPDKSAPARDKPEAGGKEPPAKKAPAKAAGDGHRAPPGRSPG